MARARRSHRRHGRPTGTDQIVERKMKAIIGEYKRGRLRPRSGARVRSPKQAVAIGMSEARLAGARIPKGPRA
jgi:uncharacterized protein DUF6496